MPQDPQQPARTIHCEHPRDCNYALCGHVITRSHPATTRDDASNVDCIACIVHLEKGTRESLD